MWFFFSNLSFFLVLRAKWLSSSLLDTLYLTCQLLLRNFKYRKIFLRFTSRNSCKLYWDSCNVIYFIRIILLLFIKKDLWLSIFTNSKSFNFLVEFAVKLFSFKEFEFPSSWVNKRSEICYLQNSTRGHRNLNFGGNLNSYGKFYEDFDDFFWKRTALKINWLYLRRNQLGPQNFEFIFKIYWADSTFYLPFLDY